MNPVADEAKERQRQFIDEVKPWPASTGDRPRESDRPLVSHHQSEGPME